MARRSYHRTNGKAFRHVPTYRADDIGSTCPRGTPYRFLVHVHYRNIDVSVTSPKERARVMGVALAASKPPNGPLPRQMACRSPSDMQGPTHDKV
jgi:hypothetical protein